MALPQLPDVAAKSFLGALRRVLVQLGHGSPTPMGRAVTFNDLAELGLVSREAAEKQAKEGR